MFKKYPRAFLEPSFLGFNHILDFLTFSNPIVGIWKFAPTLIPVATPANKIVVIPIPNPIFIRIEKSLNTKEMRVNNPSKIVPNTKYFLANMKTPP
jgi:hypothetical protein